MQASLAVSPAALRAITEADMGFLDFLEPIPNAPADGSMQNSLRDSQLPNAKSGLTWEDLQKLMLSSGDDSGDISPVTIQAQRAPARATPGIQSRLNSALGPFGGAGNLGLALLANSGYSTTPRSFGQVLGASALQGQQLAIQKQ